MATEAYYLYLGAVVITSSNNTLRVTYNTVGYDVTLTAGTYYLRGDQESDDFAKHLADRIAAATGGSFTAVCTFDVSAAALGCTLTITAAGGNAWAPDHSHGNTTLPAAFTGYASDAAPSEASAQSSVNTPECTWVPNVCGVEIERRPGDGMGHVMVDGTQYTWIRGPEKTFRRVRFDNLRRARAVELDNADPSGSFQRFFTRYRQGDPWELWRVELDASDQFDFDATPGTDRSFRGACKVETEQIQNGVVPVQPNPKLQRWSVEL